MTSTIDLYINGGRLLPYQGGNFVMGDLVGSMTVKYDDTLQTVGSSIYNYLINNRIINYSTFQLTLGQVNMFLPNDLYVPEYGRFKIRDLPSMAGGMNLAKTIRADVGNKLDIGLGEYI